MWKQNESGLCILTLHRDYTGESGLLGLFRFVRWLNKESATLVQTGCWAPTPVPLLQLGATWKSNAKPCLRMQPPTLWLQENPVLEWQYDGALKISRTIWSPKGMLYYKGSCYMPDTVRKSICFASFNVH